MTDFMKSLDRKEARRLRAELSRNNRAIDKLQKTGEASLYLMAIIMGYKKGKGLQKRVHQYLQDIRAERERKKLMNLMKKMNLK